MQAEGVIHFVVADPEQVAVTVAEELDIDRHVGHLQMVVVFHLFEQLCAKGGQILVRPQRIDILDGNDIDVILAILEPIAAVPLE